MRRDGCNVQWQKQLELPTTTVTPFVTEKLTVVSGKRQKERIDDED
ncbi:hypothetical protein EDF84_102273 [Erwinia rhapontici]|nr:hypothetical protein EDF84_102273 [Erwinia rhapontici]